jgi:hypothetical protein
VRDELELPPEIRHMPIDPSWNLPIPYIVEILQGKANFGILDPFKARECYERRLCAMCALPMGEEVALYGDVVSLEPDGFFIEAPTHERCMEIALGGVCPFISRQNYRRRRVDDPDVVVLGGRDHLPQVGREIPKRPSIVAIARSYQMVMMVTDDGTMPVYTAPKVERVRRYAWVDGVAREVLSLPVPERQVTVVRTQRHRPPKAKRPPGGRAGAGS